MVTCTLTIFISIIIISETLDCFIEVDNTQHSKKIDHRYDGKDELKRHIDEEEKDDDNQSEDR